MNVYSPLFCESVAAWLDKKALDIRPNTLLSYKVIADASIIPSLGDTSTADLTRQQIQKYFVSLKNRGVTVNTMMKHKVIIHGVLEDALIDGVVSANVADHVKLPKKEKYEGHALTEEEVGRLLARIKAEPEPLRSAITFALVYGMRRSEICGLRWKDVDLTAKVLRIRNTCTEFSGRQFETERTKSKKSRRDLFLIDDTVEYLSSLRTQQIKKGYRLDKVCLCKDGTPIKPENLTRAVKRLLKKLGYDNVRLHDLRHTAASLLARRLPVKNVQEFLGHEDVSTTLNIYTHIFDADRQVTAQTMSSILQRLSKNLA